MKKIAKFIALIAMISTSCALNGEVLPTPQTMGGMALMQAMQERKSQRDIEPTSTVTKQELSNMLWAAWGITHDGKRTIATAMNRQELELYVITATEISRYSAEDNTLTVVNTGDFRDIQARQDWAKTAPINIALVVNTDKQRMNEFQNYTAGAASHAIYLYCASVGLKTTVRAMLDNKEVSQALKLGENQRLLYIQTVGR